MDGMYDLRQLSLTLPGFSTVCFKSSSDYRLSTIDHMVSSNHKCKKSSNPRLILKAAIGRLLLDVWLVGS